jgi:hypothetical protein
MGDVAFPVDAALLGRALPFQVGALSREGAE